MPETPADAKVMKTVRDAVRSLDELEKVILPAVKGLPKREVEPAKALKAAKKTLAFLNKFEPLGKQRGSGLDKLSPAARAQVEWVGGLLDALAVVEPQMLLARKQMALKAVDKYLVLVKSAARVALQVPTPPRGTAPLVKELKKGVDPAGPLAPLIPVLPMALALAWVQDLIADAQKKRPRYP